MTSLDVHTFADLVVRLGKKWLYTECDHCMGLDQLKLKHIKCISKGEKKMLTVVPSHMIMTDVSDVQREQLIFKNLLF